MNKFDYIIEKNKEKILNKNHTNFLDPNILKKVISKLKRVDYKIYKPYDNSIRNIIYNEIKPEITLLEIISNNKLKHGEIMGSLYNLNIDSEMFGDIIIDNDCYYVIIMSNMKEVIKREFTKVGKYQIKLKEVPLNTLEKYEPKYKDINLIVSSLRIDAVISKIVGCSRDEAKNKIKNEEVFVNYEVCNKITYILKENDIFSIRKYGKYKYNKISKNTKKDNFIIEISKYID